MQDKGNGVPMQQSDSGDYYGPKGERTRVEDMANRVVGDSQWGY